MTRHQHDWFDFLFQGENVIHAEKDLLLILQTEM